MMQLSLIPALEASRFLPQSQSAGNQSQSPMAPSNRPTAAQVSYLKKLTRIKTDTQLARYVMRKLNIASLSETKGALTRQDFAKVIDLEVSEKRWAA
jgi:hypothetical protein